jgi:peptidoglycan/LPS O-acetylase OafA/YrhL
VEKPPSHYRADIDGLRALAVAAVLAFHAFPRTFRGGLVGVDIFFVISGYLISRLILADIAKGRFTVARFYARRVRRIFPALLTVLATCVVAGWLFLLPAEWTSLGRDAFAGAAFISNLALAFERTNYFALASYLRPLLHLWSLGVEEQFYFVWPLLLFMLRRRRPRTTAWVLAAIALASFVLNVAMVSRHQVMTYYLPVTRVWELALGSLLAVGEISGGVRLSGRRAQAASWIGFALCLLSIAMVEASHFPGVWALGPTVGTFLLIAAGPGAALNRRGLSARPMVATGLISYPLYLWHWPLLWVFAMAGYVPVPPPYAIACIAAATVLAVLTYRAIEMPIRTAPVNSRRLWMVCAGMVAVALIAAGAAVGVLPPRLHGPEVERIVAATKDWEYPFGDNYPRLDHFVRHDVGRRLGGAVLFVGDSHMEQFWPRIVLLARAPGAPPLRFATDGGCPPLRGLAFADRRATCDAFLDFTFEEARRPEVAKVVFCADWPAYVGPAADPERVQRALAEFTRSIADLERRGKEVDVILASAVSLRFEPRDMISLVTGRVSPQPPVPVGELDPAIVPADALIRRAAARAGAAVVDPLPFVCPNGLCPAFDARRGPAYTDRDHLRPFYVREHALFIDDMIMRHSFRRGASAPLGNY